MLGEMLVVVRCRANCSFRTMMGPGVRTAQYQRGRNTELDVLPRSVNVLPFMLSVGPPEEVFPEKTAFIDP